MPSHFEFIFRGNFNVSQISPNLNLLTLTQTRTGMTKTEKAEIVLKGGKVGKGDQGKP